VKASYRSELSTITLDEGTNSSWIMALKYGKYDHPIFGSIDITPERGQAFVANERANVRGIQMDIDYDHKRMRMDAAGWVIETAARPDGVWYHVEWTDEAADKIRSKQYKYFSSEFADMWTHPETGTIYSDVLFGGGLTNRPFIKGMVPVNLSESEAEQARLNEEAPTSTGVGGATEGGTVGIDLTAVRTALKLSEGASDEAVVEAVLAKLAEPATPVEPSAPDLTQLAESNPAIAKLLADQAQSEKRLAEMETQMRLSEIRISLNEVDEGTELTITPAVKGLAEPLMAKLPASARAELVAVLRQFAEGKGTVKLGEQGSVNPVAHATATTGDPVKKFTDLVAEIQKNDGVKGYRDAVNRAMQRDPKLFEEYRDATEAFQRQVM